MNKRPVLIDGKWYQVIHLAGDSDTPCTGCDFRNNKELCLIAPICTTNTGTNFVYKLMKPTTYEGSALP